MRKLIYYILRLIQLIHKNVSKFIHIYILKYKTSAFDKKLKIDYPVCIIYPEFLKIGENCTINRNVYIQAAGCVELGNNVTLSAFSKVISTGYDTSKWREKNNIDRKHIDRSIYIGDNAWIGSGAVILSGVRITGKGVIVAANSVVTKDIDEDYVLVAGSPATIKKRY